jgi:hypothetical protein
VSPAPGSPELEVLRLHAIKEMARVFDDPRLAQAAFDAAAATEQCSREERLVVLLLTVLSTLEHVDGDLHLSVLNTVALAQSGPGVVQKAWMRLCESVGVQLLRTRTGS